MPVDVQNTQLSSDLVALENLERNDSSIAEHIASNAAVEDLQRSIVGGIGEQRVAAAGVELDSADSLAVVAEGLVRALGQIQIVPEETTIVGTDDDVVAA